MFQMRRLALLVSLSLSVWGQLNRGSITGTITDSSGAAVPGANVSARQEGTNALTETKTNEAGQYNIPNLQTGVYTITVQSPNFKKSERTAIDLGVSQIQRVDLSLEVGSVAETITVEAQVPRVQTDSPEVGTSLNNDQLRDLPPFDRGRPAG